MSHVRVHTTGQLLRTAAFQLLQLLLKQFNLQLQLHIRSDGSGTRFRGLCVHSELVYTATYVCTLIYYFTPFPCYIELYVAMEFGDLANEFDVAPNGRHNLFKHRYMV